MTTPTVDVLADGPAQTRRLDEDVISVSSTSFGSPIMTPSSSFDRPSDSGQPTLTAEMLTTLLDRNENVSRREGILSEREKSLQQQVAAVTKREDDLDKREQELRFQKLPPLNKLQMALEQLESTDLTKATQLYSTWQLESLDDLISTANAKAQDNVSKARVFGVGLELSESRETTQLMTSNPVSAVAKATGFDTAQSKLLDPGNRSEDLGSSYDDWLNKSLGPLYAKRLVENEKFDDKLQQPLLQATSSENVGHQNEHINIAVGPPKQTCYTASKPSSDGGVPEPLSFASSGFAFPSLPGFGGVEGFFSGCHRSASIPQERKPSLLNGIDWRVVNGGKPNYLEPTPTTKAIKTYTVEPLGQPEATSLTEKLSFNKTKREPSWYESFANTSASTSKTVTVPPPPKRNWPISTKGPDLKAPTSFSNTFKVPDVNDEDSEDERNHECKDQRIPRFFRPNNPQVRSKHEERNILTARRRQVEDEMDNGRLFNGVRSTIQQGKEPLRQRRRSSMRQLSAEDLRRLMYGVME